MAPCVAPRTLVGIAFEDEKEEAASLRERLGSTNAEGEDMQAMVKILQARTEELEVSNAKLKKKAGAGRLHTTKRAWGGTSSHNEEFSRVRWSGAVLVSPPLLPRSRHRVSLAFLPLTVRISPSQIPSDDAAMAGSSVTTASDRLHSKLDSTLPQIKRQLMKAMHSQHGLDVAGFIKRHDHELSGCVSTCVRARTQRLDCTHPRFPRTPTCLLARVQFCVSSQTPHVR